MSITKENAAQWLPLVQAMCDGKAIQYYPEKGNRWEDIGDIELGDEPDRYRIKPEPQWRAWRPEEAPRAILVRSKHALLNQETAQAMFLRPESADLQYLLEYLLDNYIRIHEDGTEHPCGVLESPTENQDGGR